MSKKLKMMTELARWTFGNKTFLAGAGTCKSKAVQRIPGMLEATVRTSASLCDTGSLHRVLNKEVKGSIRSYQDHPDYCMKIIKNQE